MPAQDIDYEEFARRGEPEPFSSQRARLEPLTEEELRALEPPEDKGMVIPGVAVSTHARKNAGMRTWQSSGFCVLKNNNMNC